MRASLYEQIKRAKEEADTAARDRKMDARYSRPARMREDARTAGVFISQLMAALWWLWRHVGQPLSGRARQAALWLFGHYRRLWAYCVYRRTDDGMLLFSKTRAGLMVVATWFVLWFVILDAIDFVWDCGMYAMTGRTGEHVYLLGSQEIDHWTGGHVIKGCSALPCSDDDAVYFRTAGGWFNQLWSISHGKGLFYPEYVGAAVPHNISRCTITSYGLRFRIFVYLNTYSDLLAVTCSPIPGAAADK